MPKRILSLLLLVAMLTCSLPFSVSAENPVSSGEVILLDNGNYIVLSPIVEEEVTSARAADRTKSGSRTATLYSNAGGVIGTLTVNALFSYNNLTAAATYATYSYTEDNAFWSFSSGNAYCSSATATATGTFLYSLFFDSEKLTVSITCSPTGVLS